MLIRGAKGILTGLSGASARGVGDIRIEKDKIAAVGSLEPLPGEQIVDAAGCVVSPGLVSTHHHLFQSVMKGAPAGIDLPVESWLPVVPYRFWNQLDADTMRLAARVGMTELLLSGTSTIADHHYLFAPGLGFKPADILFEVAEELGLRLVLCRGGATQAQRFVPKGGEPIPSEPLPKIIRAIEKLARKHHDPSPSAKKRVVVAPTNLLYSMLPDDLRALAGAARSMGLRMHSHLSEAAADVAHCLRVHGKRPVRYAADNGWDGPDVWFAHLVHMDDDEVRLMAESSTGMAHCPQSNCRLGSGIAPADRLAALGGRVSLGVDGAASNEACDMISEMHCAWQIHRAAKGPAAVTADQVLHWATAGGADVLGLTEVGTIAPGMQADIALFELSGPRYAGLHDPLLAPVIGGGAPRLRALYVAGREVVRDGVIPGIDLERINAEADQAVRRMVA